MRIYFLRFCRRVIIRENEENDAEWRKRYHDRFFSAVEETTIKEDDKDDEVEKKTYESLFKED